MGEEAEWGSDGWSESSVETVESVECGKCGAGGELVEAGSCGHELCEDCARRCVVEQLGLAFLPALETVRRESPLQRRLLSPAYVLCPVLCPLINCPASIPFHRSWAILTGHPLPNHPHTHSQPSDPALLNPISEHHLRIHLFPAQRPHSPPLSISLSAGMKTRLGDLVAHARRSRPPPSHSSSPSSHLPDHSSSPSSHLPDHSPLSARLFVSLEPGHALKRTNSKEWRVNNSDNGPATSPYTSQPAPASPHSQPHSSAQPLFFIELTHLLPANPKLRKLTLPSDQFVLDLSGNFNPDLSLNKQQF